MNSDISKEQYRTCLKNCWAIPIDSRNWFPEVIDEWVEKKITELGVPYPYIAFPLITAVAYCMGESYVTVHPKYHEAVIIYSLVAGRSGTNKTASLALFSNIVKNLIFENDEEHTDHQHIYDSGTMAGLLSTLVGNNGKVLASVDEFSSFIDAMDKNTKNKDDKTRYLSLHSGASWTQKLKNSLDHIENPRFHFMSFIQNFPLNNLVMKENHSEGFLPRFIIATPKEAFTTFNEKLEASNTLDNICMQDVFQMIFSNYFMETTYFSMHDDAKEIYRHYHDEVVLKERLENQFDDIKTTVLEKCKSNLLRISAVMCVLRNTINIMSTDGTYVNCITKEDMSNALHIINYSSKCLFTLNNMEESTKDTTTAKEDLGLWHVDEEFLMLHKHKVKRIFQHPKTKDNSLLISQFTKDHLYPQLGGKKDSKGRKGSLQATHFAKGLANNNLGHYIDGDHPSFQMIDINDQENLSTQQLNLINKLGLYKRLVAPNNEPSEELDQIAPI